MSIASIRSPLLPAAAALLLASACHRATESALPAASSQEVDVVATPIYEAALERPIDELTAARIDAAVADELARREDATRETRAAESRERSREPVRTASAADGLQTSDRFRAIPIESAPTTVQPVSEALPPSPAPRQRTESLREISLVVPAGTRLEAELEDQLSSQTSRAGQPFGARLVAPVSIDGYFAFPVGAEIVGHVEEVERARRIGGRARLLLVFDHLQLPQGEVPLRASLYDETRGEGKRDAATIGGAAAAGAILGRAIGDEHRARGGTLGALIGAAIGTGIAASRQGEAIEMPVGTALELVLEEAVPVIIRVRVLDVS